jgi:hypothetical protein
MLSLAESDCHGGSDAGGRLQLFGTTLSESANHAYCRGPNHSSAETQFDSWFEYRGEPSYADE